VVQLTSAAVADVVGSDAATTVARQTALGFRYFDEVVTDSGLQSVELCRLLSRFTTSMTPRTIALH